MTVVCVYVRFFCLLLNGFSVNWVENIVQMQIDVYSWSILTYGYDISERVYRFFFHWKHVFATTKMSAFNVSSSIDGWLTEIGLSFLLEFFLYFQIDESFAATFFSTHLLWALVKKKIHCRLIYLFEATPYSIVLFILNAARMLNEHV